MHHPRHQACAGLGTIGSFSSDYEYEIRQCEMHAVCLLHPVLTRKSRNHRPSEYKFLEKSRGPHDDFLKYKESRFFVSLQKYLWHLPAQIIY